AEFLRGQRRAPAEARAASKAHADAAGRQRAAAKAHADATERQRVTATKVQAAAAEGMQAAAERAQAAAERAKEQDVVPWLRALGISLSEARRAAEGCERIPDAPLEERVKVALSCLGRGPRVARAVPVRGA